MTTHIAGYTSAQVARAQSPATGQKFSKAKDIADRLSISPRTVFRWADEGRITRYKINARIVLFDESEIAAFLNAARVG